MNASPLPLVIELACKSRDSLARSAATARKLVDDNQAQLDSLERYHADYLARRSQAPESDAAALRNFQAFISRLELAIAQQRVTLEHHRARATALQGEHTRAAIKVKSLEALAAAREAEVRRAANRIERKLEDEQASRMVRQAGLLGAAH